MNELYNINTNEESLLFDEFLIIEIVDEEIMLLHSFGPRDTSEIKKNLIFDVREIINPLLDNDIDVGGFHFVDEATKTTFDAFINMGDNAYVIFNNIALSMDEIRLQGDWPSAQEVFLELVKALALCPKIERG